MVPTSGFLIIDVVLSMTHFIFHYPVAMRLYRRWILDIPCIFGQTRICIYVYTHMHIICINYNINCIYVYIHIESYGYIITSHVCWLSLPKFGSLNPYTLVLKRATALRLMRHFGRPAFDTTGDSSENRAR
jgi:hypothetical protein